MVLIAAPPAIAVVGDRSWYLKHLTNCIPRDVLITQTSNRAGKITFGPST